MRPILTLSIAFGAALMASTAMAQAQPQSSNDPTVALPPPPPPESEPLEIDRPQQTAPAESPALGIALRGARFAGARALTEERLRPAWATYVGKDVSLSDLREIARKAERIYADAGYPFVVVAVQPQEIVDGVVEFTVVEGRISDLTVLGSDPTARRQATAAFQPLMDKETLSAEEMERAYELARTLPGLSMSGALRRGTKPGGMDLVVQTRRRGWRGYLNANNLFSEPVGPWGVLVGADFFGGSDYGDTTSVQLYSTTDWGEQKVLRLAHNRRLNGQGTTLNLSYLLADANPGDVVAVLDLATDVQAFHADVAHPIVLRSNYSMTASFGLDWSDQETTIFDGSPAATAITEDKVRVASIRAAGQWRGDARNARWAVELRQGLDIGDASEVGDPLNSRAFGRPQARVLRVSTEGESWVGLGSNMRLYGRFEGQVASDPLLAPEEFSLGNLSIGRGFDPGSAFGDDAAAFSVEARWGPYPVGRSQFRVSPFAFYDGVYYGNQDAEYVTVGARPSREHYAHSAGAGLRFEQPGRGRLDLTWAEPLSVATDLPGAVEPDGRLLVNLTMTWEDLAERAYRRGRRGEGQ